MPSTQQTTIGIPDASVFLTSTGGTAAAGDLSHQAIRVNVVAGGSTEVPAGSTAVTIDGKVQLDTSTAAIGSVTVLNPTTDVSVSSVSGVILGTSTARIGKLTSSTSEIGSFTLLNPTTSVTFTNAATTAVTITNPTTSVTVTNAATTAVSTVSSGPVLLGTSTAKIGYLASATSEIGSVTFLNTSINTLSSGPVLLGTSTAKIGFISSSTAEIGSFTFLNTSINTLSSGPILLGTSTAVVGSVTLRATTSTAPTSVLGGSTAVVGRTISDITTSTGVTSVLGGSTAVVGRTISDITTSTGVTSVLGGSTAQVGRTLSEVTTSTGQTQILGPSTAEVGRVVPSTGMARAPVYVQTVGPASISANAGTLWYISAYGTSTGTLATTIPAFVRVHNATTGNSTGSTVIWSMPLAIIATSTGGSLAGTDFFGSEFNFGPVGLACGTACSVDVTTNSTGVTAAANAKITALYTT